MNRKTALPPNPFVMARPVPPRLTAEQAYVLAAQHHSGGRLQEAETLLRQILQAQPSHAHALHLLGLIAHQSGKPEMAIDLIGKAIASNGKVALFHANLCGICRSSGRIAEAIAHGERAVALDPQMAEAYGILGLAYHDNKDYDKDEACQLQALKLQPALASALYNMGCIMRERKRADEAIAYYQKAIAARPDYLEALNDLGGMLIEERRFAEALDVLTRALRLDPDCGLAHCNAGNALNGLKRFDEALRHLAQALRLNPDYPEAHCNAGIALNGLERFDEALRHLARSLRLNPDYPDAHCNTGIALNGLEHFDKALWHLLQALRLNPDYPDALITIARTYQAKHELADAEQAALRALELTADNKAEVHSVLGSIYTEMGGTVRAVACFNRALELDPEFADALLGKGNYCMEMGEFAQAEQLFHQALEHSRNKLPARAALSQVKKVRIGDENLAALAAMNEQADSLPEIQLRSLHFALGKCYDDVGDYAQAFRHFQEGGRLKRKEMDYDPAAQTREFDRIIEIFEPSFLARLQGRGNTSNLPIFVLGMPRSGTTLTEQIIASHPDVHAAGELTDLMQIAKRATTSGEVFPENLNGLTPELLAAWGEDYVVGIRKRAPDAHRITDKMPGNFMVLGLIHAMLPNVRIVHVSRNPVDNCLSCFTKQFGRYGHAYSYDLAELGKYYADYARLMTHWRRVLPEGAFLDMRYEDLVADNEAQARRLIAYCGLEWNDACLESHKTKRSVRTASVTQVRQPIYASSVERWRKYEEFLKPLLDELGDLAVTQGV